MRGRWTRPWFIKVCWERERENSVHLFQVAVISQFGHPDKTFSWLNFGVASAQWMKQPKGMPWQDRDCPEFAIWYRTLDIKSFLPLFTSAMKVEWECSSVMCLDQGFPDKPLISLVSNFTINHFSSGLNSFLIELGNLGDACWLIYVLVF